MDHRIDAGAAARTPHPAAHDLAWITLPPHDGEHERAAGGIGLHRVPTSILRWVITAVER